MQFHAWIIMFKRSLAFKEPWLALHTFNKNVNNNI